MINNFFLTLITAFFFINVTANNFWQEATLSDFENLKIQIKTTKSTNYILEHSSLNTFLDLADNQFKSIEIPMPNGTFLPFYIKKNTTMAQELSAKFSNIQTFDIYNDNLNITGKVDLTPKGFHAMVFTVDGSFFIDPLSKSSNKIHVSYWKKDFDAGDKVFKCEFEENDIVDNSLKGINESNGSLLKNYRLAMSATAEYTDYHGGTVSDGLSAIVTTVNRINGVYEREFSVTLTLIADNDLIIYTDPDTDPFVNPSSASTILTNNQSSLGSTIGNENYDIGHVVGRSGSGLAWFAAVCNNMVKARGTTGISDPIGDPFDIDYVAHEIGHQFGGSHTFNGNDGSCSGNVSLAHSYEPGSGTTIMAYAGICGTSNTQNFSNDYFHSHNITQVVTFINGAGNCATVTDTENNIPVLETYTNSGFIIPISTPFELEATGSDADDDIVTFCWEQYDLGPQGDPNNPVDNAPLFRSFFPKTIGTRTFPQMSDIVSQTQTKGEIMADYQRDMTFRVTLRDGKGATDYDEMDLSVTATAGPFEVTSQNGIGETWSFETSKTITWDVANTNSSPINCSSVSIFMSLDKGVSFPITLSSNVPNGGLAIIMVPGYSSDETRIKVKGDNNIFFNINEEDIDLNPGCNMPDSITISINEDVLYSSYFGTNKWFLDGIEIAGETGQVITATEIGIYTVQAVNGDCISLISHNNIEVTAKILSIKDTNLGSLKVNVFPNPSSRFVQINFTDFDTDINIQLIDIIGNKVYSKITNSKNNIVDLKNYTEGIYFIILSNNKNSYSEKIILKK